MNQEEKSFAFLGYTQDQIVQVKLFDIVMGVSDNPAPELVTIVQSIKQYLIDHVDTLPDFELKYFDTKTATQKKMKELLNDWKVTN